jgi:predicted phosphohydrolase
LIESNDKLEENWILKLKTDDSLKVEEDIKTVMEIHYKALEYIFLEALSFINEKYKNL